MRFFATAIPIEAPTPVEPPIPTDNAAEITAELITAEFVALTVTAPALLITASTSVARVFVRMLFRANAPAPLTATPVEPPIATPAAAAAEIALMLVRETSIWLATVDDSVSV